MRINEAQELVKAITGLNRIAGLLADKLDTLNESCAKAADAFAKFVEVYEARRPKEVNIEVGPIGEPIPSESNEPQSEEVYKCDVCGKILHAETLLRTAPDGKVYCYACAVTHLDTCKECGDPALWDETVKKRSDGKLWCDICWEER